MGYRSPLLDLDLEEFKGETPENSLQVKVVAPNVREGADINAGRRKNADGEFVESSEDYTRRVIGYLAPKIRFWNFEDDQGRIYELPRDMIFAPETTPVERLDAMVDYLFELDENIVLGIYHEWRTIGLAKPKDSKEGKAPETPSTPGHDASVTNGEQVDVRALEMSIPMG